MESYKQDIINTRKGCLGSSDAKLLHQVDMLGGVPQSAHKRLAVCKGLIENENVTTKVMEYGDFIEQSIFSHLSSIDGRYQSNPCLVSEKYSTEEVKIIDHIDFMLKDDENKILKLFECKASKFTIDQVRNMYECQLYHHYLLGSELAEKLGGYKVKVMLVYYNTEDVNLDEPWEFNPDKVTIRPVRFARVAFNMKNAVSIISEFIKNFDVFYKDEEIDANLLPLAVKNEFDAITSIISEIKEREAKADEFKKKLCQFMLDKHIKSIKNDNWSITLVGETETVSFDGKRYISELAEKHPRKAASIKKKYERRTKKSAYVTIKIKNK